MQTRSEFQTDSDHIASPAPKKNAVSGCNSCHNQQKCELTWGATTPNNLEPQNGMRFTTYQLMVINKLLGHDGVINWFNNG